MRRRLLNTHGILDKRPGSPTELLQYDPSKMGLFCAACFARRHPPYRVEHHYQKISDMAQIETEINDQKVRGEIDRQVYELQAMRMSARL